MNLQKLLRQAEKLISYGKISEAIETYQEILTEDFQNLEVHNLVADLYAEKRDMQRASRHLFKVASDYASQGNLADAAAAYRKIVKILPKNILARERLVDIFTKSNSRGDVINLTTELCSIAESEGNAQKTIEYLEKLIALDTGNKSHLTKLALFLNEHGLKHKSIEVFYQLAQDYIRKERYEDALAVLEKVRAIDPKEKTLTTCICEIYEKQGKIEKAIEVLLTSMAENPAQPPIMAYLARLCIKAGKVDEAERIYEKLIKINKSFLAQILPFVEVLLADRRVDRALTYIDRLHKEIQDSPTRQRCVELLEEILKIDPQKLEAYRLLEAFYGSTFRYDQLAITLQSHADAYVAKCEHSKALDVARQLVDLEPYNEEYRKRYQQIEKLQSGGSRVSVTKPAQAGPEEEDEESDYVPAKVDANFDGSVSIVTDEDVENFIVDIELLEKFGQHASAIGRLEYVLKRYPQEIKLREKLKALYFDRRMPKRAAQECLEIAKILQHQDQKEEANKYLREAQRLNPVLSSAKPDAPTAEAQPARQATSEASGNYVALRGDLSEIGLLDVIQLLENCQKNGKLLIASEKRAGTISFNGGRIVNAAYQDKCGEQAVYALVAVKGGTFDYQPSAVPFDVVIHNSNTNLLLEGLRLLDESNREQGESEVLAKDAIEPPAQSKSVELLTPTENSPAPFMPALANLPISQFIDDDNPLDEI
jgi:tetratricopeptide (TPR) repeat protein